MLTADIFIRNIRTAKNKRVIVFSLLAVLLLVSNAVFLFYPQSIYAAGWYNSNWRYRKEITVANASADYQTKVLVGKTSAAVGEDVDCNGHVEDDFADIRFAAADGTTLLDYWIEQIVDSGGTKLATVWVQNNAVPDVTFYMYYGNAAAVDASSGTDTFIFFDDFDRGNDGDNVGNGWTEGAARVEISTDQAWDGTRSMKLEGQVATYPQVLRTDITASANIAIRHRTYIETTQGLSSIHGGARAAYWLTDVPDNLYYYNGAPVDTGYNITPDTWILIEMNDYDHAAFTYDMWVDEAERQANAGMWNNAGYADDLYFWANALGVGNDIYIDDVIVRKWASTEQTFSAFGAEEDNNAPTVVTLSVSGIGHDWAILRGEITVAPVLVTEWGFDYGLTSTYGSSSTTTGGMSTGVFSAVITGLTPGTVYHYRAKASAGSFSYGGDFMFATKGSPVIYEYYNTGDDGYWCDNATGNQGIFANRIAYQTFTTNSTDVAHTVTHIKLLLGRIGATPGSTYVSLRRTSGDIPTGEDLAASTKISTGFSTTHTWQDFELDDEVALEPDTKYAVLVQSPSSSDNTTCVRWRWDSGGGDLFGGNAGISTSGGVSFGGMAPKDCLYELWGNYALEVLSARVSENYLNDDEGDWLITCLYNNIYPPYYEAEDAVEDYFEIRLMSASGNTTLARTRCSQWGYRPGSIYLNEDKADTLVWGSAYLVRIMGKFAPYPYMEYALTDDDWLGEDLTRLDKYMLSIAKLMEEQDDEEYITYLASKGEVLNDTANALFNAGIPTLVSIRPNIFRIAVENPTPRNSDFTNDYQDYLIWQTALGTQLTTTFTEIGNTFSVDGRVIGSAIFFLLYALVASFGFMSGHGIAGLVIGFPIIIAATFIGVIPIVVLAVILGVALLFFVWKVIFVGG